MTRNLIIGIGNIARGDDGVGHDVARRLLAFGLPADTRVITAVGLDVAMSADVAESDRLLVLDAERRSAPAVEVRTIVPGTAAHSGHGIDGPGLLAVTHALYDAAPAAFVISIAAPEMGHGETLSATAEAASSEAASVVLDLIRGT